MIDIDIPHFYKKLSIGYSEDLFKNYVIGYMSVSYPELKPKQIDPDKMIVLCERR